MYAELWRESQRERDHYGDLDVGGSTILNWNFENHDGVLWTRFIWLRIGASDRGLGTW
jgi:hypothetical protein